MEEFGVLTKRFGLKPQGKSAPMAASRRPTPSINNPKTTSYSRSSSDSDSISNSYASFLDYQNGFFSQSQSQPAAASGTFNGYDDFFGGGGTRPAQVSDFNLDVFSGSSSVTTSFNDGFDVFGSSGGSVNSNVREDDFFGSFSSAPKQSAAPSNDLLGDLGGVRRKLQSMNNGNGSGNRNGAAARNVAIFDDLLPGFGVSSGSNREYVWLQQMPDDLFFMFMLEMFKSSLHTHCGCAGC